ncbi:C4b-binding protein-like isoform 2-T2 [Clarias gariepinus]
MLRCMVILTVLLMTAVNAQEKSCGNPGVIDNGHYQTPGGLLFGATITAVCNKGYELQGQQCRRCRDYGWDGSAPVCKKKSCGNPCMIVNGHYQTPGGLLFGATITAVCNEGYKLQGQPHRKCEDYGWDGSAPVCAKKSCENPGVIDNGKYLIPDGLLFGATITAVCNESYKLRGQQHRRCRDNGWDGSAPVCESYRKEQSGKLTCRQNGWEPSDQWCIEITCDLPSIKNAVINPSSSPYKYGSSVQISCNEGYKIEGTDVLTCWDHGWNSSLPQCIDITCDSPSIPNGVISYISPLYMYGDSIQIWCSQGFRIEGSDNLTCRQYGWNPPLPQCIVVAGVALLRMKNRECEECKAPSNPEDSSLGKMSSSDSIAEET